MYHVDDFFLCVGNIDCSTIKPTVSVLKKSTLNRPGLEFYNYSHVLITMQIPTKLKERLRTSSH